MALHGHFASSVGGTRASWACNGRVRADGFRAAQTMRERWAQAAMARCQVRVDAEGRARDAGVRGARDWGELEAAGFGREVLVLVLEDVGGSAGCDDGERVDVGELTGCGQGGGAFVVGWVPEFGAGAGTGAAAAVALVLGGGDVAEGEVGAGVAGCGFGCAFAG